MINSYLTRWPCALWALSLGAAHAEMILSNDIVNVGYFGAGCTTGSEKLIVRFDLCCECFRWTFNGDSSAVKKADFTVGDDSFGWLSNIHAESCIEDWQQTASKVATSQCVQQTEGIAYFTKITSVERRSEACTSLDQASLQCEQGPFPNESYNVNWRDGPATGSGAGGRGGAQRGRGAPACPTGESMKCQDGSAAAASMPPCTPALLPPQCCDSQNVCYPIASPGGAGGGGAIGGGGLMGTTAGSNSTKAKRGRRTKRRSKRTKRGKNKRRHRKAKNKNSGKKTKKSNKNRNGNI